MTALKKLSEYRYVLGADFKPPKVIQGSGDGGWGFDGNLTVTRIETVYYVNVEDDCEWLDVFVYYEPLDEPGAMPYGDSGLETEITVQLMLILPQLFDSAGWSEHGMQNSTDRIAHLDGFLYYDSKSKNFEAQMKKAGFIKETA